MLSHASLLAQSRIPDLPFAVLSPPKLSFEIPSGKFVVKTLHEAAETDEAFRLRHDVFHTEHHGRVLPGGLDRDRIDGQCDHLGIIDRESKKLVGTYRLVRSDRASLFYTAQRFDLSPLFKCTGLFVELGRACVRPEYRQGSVIQLLWRGIAEYAERAGADTLFGAASVRTHCSQTAASLHVFFENRGYLTAGNQLVPREEFSFPEFFSERQRAAVCPRFEKELPSLVLSYLRMGAKIASYPAYDRFLGSADFLAVLPWKNLAGRFKKRFHRN